MNTFFKRVGEAIAFAFVFAAALLALRAFALAFAALHTAYVALVPWYVDLAIYGVSGIATVAIIAAYAASQKGPK